MTITLNQNQIICCLKSCLGSVSMIRINLRLSQLRKLFLLLKLHLKLHIELNFVLTFVSTSLNLYNFFLCNHSRSDCWIWRVCYRSDTCADIMVLFFLFSLIVISLFSFACWFFLAFEDKVKGTVIKNTGLQIIMTFSSLINDIWWI